MRVRPSALIIHNDSLLTMRYHYGGSDVYMLPGGNPDPGETLREALRRELHEELGIEAEIGEMVLCGEVIAWGGKEDTLHCVFEVLHCAGQPLLDPGHTSAAGIDWVPVYELKNKVLYPQVASEIMAFLEGSLPAAVHVGTIEQPYL